MSRQAEQPDPPVSAPLELLAAMRPKQWTKNLFVFVAMVFTDNWSRIGIVAVAFVLFCLISASVYLVNDIVDRDQDRYHPEKCRRPIASGRLSWNLAAVAAVVLAAVGTASGFAINTQFGVAAAAYLVLQIAYTFVLKHEVLLDVFAIAAGFVLRTVAGAFALGVPNSPWLLVCMLQLALFLGFGKRRHELVTLEGLAANHRQTLSQYTVPYLDQLMAVVLGGLTVSYGLYTINSSTAERHPMVVLTLPFVLYGIFRYLYLIHVRHKGGSPELVLMEDRPLQITLMLWLAVVVAAFRVA